LKIDRDRMFQVDSKIRQRKLDDKTRRENRNRKVSYLLTDKVDCRIEVLDGICEDGKDETRIWGSRIVLETDEGTITTVVRGKTRNMAEVLTRTFLDKMGVRYKITRGS